VRARRTSYFSRGATKSELGILSSAKPGSTKGELTRQDLLSAARAVFAKAGYGGAETGQIAREAGKSSGVFYIYFENKDDLLATLVDEFRAELHAAIRGPLNAPEEIGDVLTTLWDVYKKHAGTFIALTEASSTSDAFARMAFDLRDYGKRDYANMIRQRQRAGACAALDAEIAGAAIETMVNYCLYEWLARDLAHFEDEAHERKALGNLIGIVRAALEAEPSARSAKNG
jgi:AcrR family transcriptional regulator